MDACQGAVAAGTYNLVAGDCGALGCNLGSIVAHVVGMWGGYLFLYKYGKYVLVSRHDLELVERWFSRRGNWIVFISRLLPVVRTLISLPAGIARMGFIRFLISTFTSSFI